MNVLGGPLQCCCKQPLTGYYRDGYCRTGGGDFGVHVVCAQVRWLALGEGGSMRPDDKTVLRLVSCPELDTRTDICVGTGVSTFLNGGEAWDEPGLLMRGRVDTV